MKTTSIIAAATAATLIAAPLAQAQPEEFAFDFVFDPAQLTTIEGASEILADLENRVERECRVYHPGSRIIDSIITDACVDDAMDRAIKHINSGTLSAAYEGSEQG